MFSVIENIWMSKKDQPKVLANLFGNKLLNWAFSLIFEQGTFENVIGLVDLVLEKVKVNDLQYWKEREHSHIQKFQTFYRGLNLQP